MACGFALKINLPSLGNTKEGNLKQIVKENDMKSNHELFSQQKSVEVAMLKDSFFGPKANIVLVPCEIMNGNDFLVWKALDKEHFGFSVAFYLSDVALAQDGLEADGLLDCLWQSCCDLHNLFGYFSDEDTPLRGMEAWLKVADILEVILPPFFAEYPEFEESVHFMIDYLRQNEDRIAELNAMLKAS
jgi:hypothetical protein